jgi:hypothetical protein
VYLGLERLDGLGREPEANHAVALRPKDALPLQINLLDLVITNVREGNGHAIVGSFPQKHALPTARLLLGLYRPCCGASHLHTQEIRSARSAKAPFHMQRPYSKENSQIK